MAPKVARPFSKGAARGLGEARGRLTAPCPHHFLLPGYSATLTLASPPAAARAARPRAVARGEMLQPKARKTAFLGCGHRGE